MRIESANMNLQGNSMILSTQEVTEELRVWNRQGGVLTEVSADRVSFSAQANRISSEQTVSAASVTSSYGVKEEGAIETEHDLKIRLIETFIFNFIGKKVDLQVPKFKLTSDGYDGSGKPLGNIRLVNPSSPGNDFGIVYNRFETQAERSRVSFAAEGLVKTSDGREIKLDLRFNIDQQIIKQSSIQLRAGAALKDPLVINFNGSLASFTDRTMIFDLDFNGTADQMQMLSENSGFLALDKNNNGIIDDGRELFGPSTDYGYSELSVYDEDGNGWIDEGDSIFDQLKIWYHDGEGKSHLVALTDKNVGAIYLGHVETEMNLYQGTEMAGKLRHTGLVLLENGQSRIMQELDLRI